MARQIVHDDDVALRERGDETFFRPVLERGGIHRLVESLLRHEARKAQPGHEGDRLIMAMRNADAQPPPAPAASAFARQIGGSPGFIDENELPRIEVELRPKPRLTLLQDVRALLLLGMRGLFLARLRGLGRFSTSRSNENNSLTEKVFTTRQCGRRRAA